MKFGWLIGLVVAVVLHAGFLLFGGLIVGTNKDEKAKVHQVDLVSEETAAEKPKQEPEDQADNVKKDAEEVPDAAEVVRSLEVSAAAAAPELEAASLASIEQALNGGGGAAGFGESLGFASGGKIGGTGKAGSLDGKLENAFNMSEIDQKPRATFQAPPTYPTEMRGKKVEGVVTVIFIVDPSGKVSSPKVEKSSHPAFDRPALEAVRQWRFEAGLRGGERVSCKMRVPIKFQKS